MYTPHNTSTLATAGKTPGVYGHTCESPPAVNIVSRSLVFESLVGNREGAFGICRRLTMPCDEPVGAVASPVTSCGEAAGNTDTSFTPCGKPVGGITHEITSCGEASIAAANLAGACEGRRRNAVCY